MHVRSGTSEDCELLRIFFIKTTAFPFFRFQKYCHSSISDCFKFNRSDLLCQLLHACVSLHSSLYQLIPFMPLSAEESEIS